MNNKSLPSSGKSSRLSLISQVKEAFEFDKPIRISDRRIVTTKARPEYPTIVFRRCAKAEELTKLYYPKPDSIAKRLKEYDHEFNFEGYPHHYPVQIVEGSGNAIYRNVFFPLSRGKRLQNQVGFECVDSWRSHHYQVIDPVVKTVFDRISVELIASQIDPGLISLYCYWLSLAHEWGHSVGPFKIFSPTKAFSKLNSYLQGTFGETAANLTAALLTPEHPEIALWLLIIHVAFTARKGYRADPLKGRINSDNDTCSGILLFQRMERDGAIEVTVDHKLHLNMDLILPCFETLRIDLDHLASEAFQLSSADCNEICYEWLRKEIPFLGETFVFPEYLKKVYSYVQMLPEFPEYLPLLPFIVD